MSAKNCTTHHHACDCREAMFAEVLEALQAVVGQMPFTGNESEYELVQAGCDPTEARVLSNAFNAIAKATGDQA